MAVSKRLRYEILRRDNHTDWRPIPSTEGFYEASREGLVRSVDRRVERADGRHRSLRGRVLKPVIDPQTGYQRVSIYRDGQKTDRHVHALVAEAFLGPRPAGKEVAHKNGDKLNCRLDNLRYATPAENQADRVEHGTSNRGVRNWSAVLTAADVQAIARRLDAGVFQRGIAAEFGISRTTVSAIATGRTWGYLTGRGAPDGS